VIQLSNSSTIPQQASFFVTALWWGSLTTVGFMVVPMLFARMDSMQAAGKMAAALFNAQDYVGWVCGAVLGLVYMQNKPLAQQNRARATLYLIAVTLLASLVSHWLVAPQILTRENLKLWHSLGTGL